MESEYLQNDSKDRGVLYLAGMVVGISGIILFQSVLGAPDPLSAVSANSMLLAIGAILWLMAVVGDAAHGVLMFPVLKPHSERIAVGYLGFRILDAAFIAIMVLFILVQIPIGSEYLKAGADASYLQALSNVFMQAQLDAYNLAMITLGVASLMLCYTLYRAKLVPRFLAVWGLVGYAIILCGSVLEVLGFGLLSIHAIPGGLWELFIGVWLIVKGFNPPAIVPEIQSAPRVLRGSIQPDLEETDDVRQGLPDHRRPGTDRQRVVGGAYLRQDRVRQTSGRTGL